MSINHLKNILFVLFSQSVFSFQKKKPDWALGAKEGEGKARAKP
jgi:hypothetical protein